MAKKKEREKIKLISTAERLLGQVQLDQMRKQEALDNLRQKISERFRAETMRIYEELLSAGVRIFEFQASMMHAKTAVVDDGWAIVGSANMDIRSKELNEENVLGIRDAAFAAELERTFLAVERPQLLAGLLQVVQQHGPHGRHGGGERHAFLVHQPRERLGIAHLRAREHELRADHRRVVGQTPGIGVEHRHHLQDRVALARPRPIAIVAPCSGRIHPRRVSFVVLEIGSRISSITPRLDINRHAINIEELTIRISKILRSCLGIGGDNRCTHDK